MCLGLAIWNGRDPILKERMFGLTNGEGNHGEDVKECWWYLDAVPSKPGCDGAITTRRPSSPTSGSSTRTADGPNWSPSSRLLDTGIFDDDRYWIVEVHYAKADAEDLLMRVTVRNMGPEAATVHVLPTRSGSATSGHG